jgi:mannose-6-phosphate isomerase-like protein (cupin superfamily)
MTRALVVRETDVEPVTWSDPVRGDVLFRTMLGGATTRADFTAGVTRLAPGGWLGHHRHDPSEVYFVLSGTGVLTIDGHEHPVSAGTAAYLPSRSEHGIHNTGDEPLRFFYAFAIDSFEKIDYDFTGADESTT